MRKTLILLIFTLFPILLSCQSTYREGDIIFQISDSQQSNMIQFATMSPCPTAG